MSRFFAITLVLWALFSCAPVSADLLPSPGWPRPQPRPPRPRLEESTNPFDGTDLMATAIVISLLGLAVFDGRRKRDDSTLED